MKRGGRRTSEKSVPGGGESSGGISTSNKRSTLKGRKREGLRDEALYITHKKTAIQGLEGHLAVESETRGKRLGWEKDEKGTVE